MTDKENLIDMLKRAREDFYIEDARGCNAVVLPYEGVRFQFSPMDELLSVFADLAE